MIVLAGTLRILSDDRDAVLRSMEDLQDKTWAEDEGVITYHFSIDLKDKNLVHVYEEWNSTANLKAHGQKEHMDPFRKLREEKKVEVVRFSRWIAEELGEY